MAQPLRSDEPRSPIRPSAVETRTAAIAQVLEPGHGFTSVTEKISTIVLRPGIRRGWLFGFVLAFLVVLVFLVAVTNLVLRGTGIWGVNTPVGWGFGPRPDATSPSPEFH